MRPSFITFILLASVSIAQAKPGKPQAKPRVVLISVDGLRADLAQTMPFFVEAAKSGVSSFEASAPVPSVTVVSNAELFTGRLPADNGVSAFEPKDAKLGTWRPLKVLTIFQAARKKGLRTATFAMKRKLDGLLPIEALDFHGTVFPASKTIVERYCAALATKSVVSYDLVFLHFAEIDAVGHAVGWMTPEQLKAAADIDVLLSKVAKCLKEDDARRGRSTLLIVTSDHGGHDKTHGTDSDEDTKIPWVALGHGVAAGNRLDVSLVDTAVIISDALGLGMKDLVGSMPDGLYDH